MKNGGVLLARFEESYANCLTMELNSNGLLSNCVLNSKIRVLSRFESDYVVWLN